MVIKDKLQKLVFEAATAIEPLARSKISLRDIELTHPANPRHGDYSTNIAFRLAAKLKADHPKGNFLENVDWILKGVNAKNFETIQPKNGLPVGKLNPEAKKILGAKSELVFFKPRVYAKIKGWWKHFSGHPEITADYFYLLPYVLYVPEKILADKFSPNRFLLLFRFEHHAAVVVEVERGLNGNQIITYFWMRENQPEEHKTLWTAAGRTCIPSVLAHPAQRGVAGSRFPGLQPAVHVKNYISRLDKKSQGGILIYEKKPLPQVLAKELVACINPKIEKIEEIKKVEAVGGFVNFRLTEKFFSKQIKEVLAKREKFGKPAGIKKQKIVIEFGQPNTHKLPHIGHLRSYALGESLARLLEFVGRDVFRANYQGDVGLHVAKCLWALGRVQGARPKAQNPEEKVKLLQRAYVRGNQAYEQDLTAKEEIDNLNIQIYQKDPAIFDLWQKTRQWSLDYYKALNQRLGTGYHRLYFESEAAKLGKKIVQQNLGNVFKESQGAIIFEGSRFGLHDRVFITATGNPTYEAKDLALIFLKQKDFDYDLSLISTAREQVEYFKVVYQAASLIDKNLAEKFVHIPFGLVSLSRGKLSSRQGSILSIDEVLSSVERELRAVMQRKNYQARQIEKVIDVLTVGAAKYSLLKNAPSRDMLFDIKESVALEGHSGPYLQYTYARTRSILRKAKTQLEDHSFNDYKQKDCFISLAEKPVLQVLYQFPEIVKQAAQEYAPNLICNYLFELAQKFNSFYEKERVIGHKKESFRLGMVEAVGRVVKSGLKLLGIEVLAKM